MADCWGGWEHFYFWFLARKGPRKTLGVTLKWVSADSLGKKEQSVKIMYDEFKDQINNM